MSEHLSDTNIGNIEYINKQDAVDALEAKKDKSAKGDIGCFYNTIIQNTIDALNGLPSADVVQAAHSEWIYHMSFGVCKKCGYEYEWKGTDAKNYCPNCGAKMDGKE